MTDHTYRIFGLCIKLPFELPGLESEITDIVDVEVVFGSNPEHLGQIGSSGILFEANHREFLLRLPQIGSYHTSGGNRVIIDAKAGASESEIRLFLLGSVLGAILYQRGLTPMHGSANEVNGSALLTLGNSAAGKSTLAASLHKEGYHLISDDLTAVSLDNNSQCQLLQGLPFIKLWGDVKEELDLRDSYERVRPQLKKYIIPTSPGKQEHYNLTRVIQLTSKNTEGIVIEKVSGAGKIKILREHLFRDQLIKGMGLAEQHFSKLAIIAKQVEVFQVERPSAPLDIEKLRNAIIENILTS